jgi:hypothetical protein
MGTLRGGGILIQSLKPSWNVGGAMSMSKSLLSSWTLQRWGMKTLGWRTSLGLFPTAGGGREAASILPDTTVLSALIH